MRESDLYKPVHDFLEIRFRGRLKPTYGDIRSVSAVTAETHGAGHWSNPDLALAALWRTKYGLNWSFDLHGFEVKTEANCTPAAVHEALSQATLVNYSHLVWHKPTWSLEATDCQAILERCQRYGIGLITFVEPADADSFVVHSPARRHDTSDEAVDEFIETRFPKAAREQLTKWAEELR